MVSVQWRNLQMRFSAFSRRPDGRRSVHVSYIMVGVTENLPKVRIDLWRADAIVLFDWLMSVDVDNVPVEHPSQQQALMDLLNRLETDTDVPYGESGTGLTQEEINAAQVAVSKDMSGGP